MTLKKQMDQITQRMKEQKIGQHLSEHRELYIGIGTGVALAGFTVLIMRGVASQSISRDVIVTAGRDAIVARKKIAMHNVSFISADRQGPPSWVVRCKETGDIFTSQNAAASALDITASNISRQLNGLQENAQGYHFERICLAA